MPTLSSASNTTTTATSITSRLGAMQLNSTIPVPSMVTRSLTPYTGPDFLTELPTELMQNVASNLDAESIQALRLVNSAASAKCQFSFVKTSLHSLKIDMTKVGMRRGLLRLKKDFVSETTRQVTFTIVAGQGYVSNGSRPTARANAPAKGDLTAILDHLPNVNTIALRDTSHTSSIVPQSIAHALAASPRTKLTDLTIDGCMISIKTLESLLDAHRHTLRYLALRNLVITDGSLSYWFLKTLEVNFGLTRLLIDGIMNKEPRGELFEVYNPNALDIIATEPGQFSYMVREHECEDCGNFQRYVITEFSASMTGHAGVQNGLAKILAARGSAVTILILLGVRV